MHAPRRYPDDGMGCVFCIKTFIFTALSDHTCPHNPMRGTKTCINPGARPASSAASSTGVSHDGIRHSLSTHITPTWPPALLPGT